MPVENSNRSSRLDNNSASLAESNLVSDVVRNVDQTPNTVASNGRSIIRPHGQSTSVATVQQFTAGGLESIRAENRYFNVSDDVRKLCANARRPGSKRTYVSSWNKFARWGSARKVDPFCSSVEFIADFLAHCHLVDKVEYGALGVLRSAISTYHAKVAGVEIGRHPLIKELMTGAFNARPPKP